MPMQFKLYSDTSLTGVNIETYFENLIQGLFDTYNISEDKIHLVKNITPLILDVDTVIPLGLISNELISNQAAERQCRMFYLSFDLVSS